MHKALILAAGFLLAATAAWSQGSSRDGYDGRDSRDERGWRRDGDGRGHRMRDDDDEGRGRRGARFWVRSGDTRIGVKCDESESMRACVDAALTLFDRTRSQAPSGTSGSTSPGASTPSR
jgi:hypothetical protein